MIAVRSHQRPTVRSIRSRSPEETERLGRQLACTLAVPEVVLLCGPLGIGKTTLARGLAQGLGVEDPASVHSPSFTIVNIYQGRCPIYHVDLYRLAGERDLSSVGLEDFLGRDGVTIVEWGERLSTHCDAALVIELEDAGGDARILRIRQTGARNRQRTQPRRGT
ncbi:MAG: tRNA (adenosine(37)-N6)-threonylcarbamoyltransferase complex ATPase subunit type 1 TsaE [Acidobacteriia bacterium]|nr:tRNA (adenosine(37)-N6)-threonylcarbamoyltransferase complex ATPase subunit type 1 TsaE [Terriglobia bacterium]